LAEPVSASETTEPGFSVTVEASPTLAPEALVPAALATESLATESPIAVLPEPAVEAAAAVPVAPLVLPAGAEAELEAAAQALEDFFAASSDVLADLSSYRYTTTFSYSGTEDGKPESGSIEVQGAVASAERQTMAWKDLETDEEFAILRVGARAWVREGEEWDEVPELVADAMSQGLLIYSPLAGWSMFAKELETTSKYLGSETVNGVPTKHYATSYLGWSSAERSELTDAEGDVWIAEDGYPVRYRFVAKTTSEDGSRGTALWTMDLTDVNVPISIEAPQ